MRDIPQRSRRCGNLFAGAGSRDVFDQALIGAIDDLASGCGFEESIAMIDDSPRTRQAFLNIKMVAAINHGAIIVVPDTSTCGDESRNRAMDNISRRVNNCSSANRR